MPSPRGKVPTSSCGGRRMRVDRVTASSVRQQTYKLQFERHPVWGAFFRWEGISEIFLDVLFGFGEFLYVFKSELQPADLDVTAILSDLKLGLVECEIADL